MLHLALITVVFLGVAFAGGFMAKASGDTWDGSGRTSGEVGVEGGAAESSREPSLYRGNLRLDTKPAYVGVFARQ